MANTNSQGYAAPTVIPIGYGAASLGCNDRPLMVPFVLHFPNANGGDNFALGIPAGQGVTALRQVQSVLIDNSASAFDTTLAFSDGQTIIAPAFSRGFYQVATNSKSFTATNEAGQNFTTTATVRVSLFNVAFEPEVNVSSPPVLASGDALLTSRIGNYTASGSIVMDATFNTLKTFGALKGSAATPFYYITNFHAALIADKAALADTAGLTISFGDFAGGVLQGNALFSSGVFFSVSGTLAVVLCSLNGLAFFGSNTFGALGSGAFSGSNVGYISVSVAGGVTASPLF